MVSEPGTYWHMLPEASQARKAIWEAVNPKTGRRRIDDAFPKALRDATREQEMFIRTVNGSTWQVLGSDNYDSLVGSPPRGVVFSEWALANPQAWSYIRPILAENGGWALFISTPRGRNHLATMYDAALHDDGWFSEKLTADDTDVFTAETLIQERQEYVREYGETDGLARFRQEYYCDFDAPLLGAYYGSEIKKAEEEGRITNVPHDDTARVNTWWDLGIGDSTAIWFTQNVGKEVRCIDYHEAQGEGLSYYVQVIEERAKAGNWTLGDHVLPHDAQARELGTGKTREEVLRSLGITPQICPKHNVDDGIQAARSMLAYTWFDAEKCRHGLECLRSYQKAWDEKKRVFASRPLHDWASHAADAFRYGAMARPVTRKRKPIEYPKLGIV